MKRLRVALLLLLALGATLALVLARLPSWTASLVASRVSAAFERPASVGEVRFGLLPARVEIDDVSVGALTAAAPPFLHVRRVTIVPVLPSLWGPRLLLDRVELEGPTVRINAFPRGGDDIPKPRGGGGPGVSVRIRRLQIGDGLFVLNHTRVPLELDLPDFGGELRGEGGGVLRGRISFGPGELQFGTAASFPVGTDIELLLDGPTLTLTRGVVEAQGTHLTYGGQIRIAARPQGELVLEGPVSLDLLDRHMMRTGFEMRGAGRYSGTLGIDGSRLTLRGRMEGVNGWFDGIPVPRFAGGLDWDGDGVHIRGLAIEALGGSARMDIEVPPRPHRASWSGEIEEADAEATLQAIFDIGPVGVAARTTGGFALDWERGRFRESLNGEIAVAFTPRPETARRALDGTLQWSAAEGLQELGEANLRLPTVRATLAGTIAVDDATALTLRAESTDIADADRALRRLRQALGNPEAAIAGFSGSGRFDGVWRGTLMEPVFEGRATATDAGFRGVVWGEVEWVGVTDPISVTSRSLVARRGGATLWLDGRTEIGWLGESDALDARLRLERWPVEDLITALDFDLDVEGDVSGDVRLLGRRSHPQGPLVLELPRGRYYGVPFRDLRVEGEMRGVEVTGSGRARVGGGDLRFGGALGDDGLLDGRVSADGVEVSELLPTPEDVPSLGGRISGEAVVQGPPRRPRLEASLRAPRLFLGDEALGETLASLVATGDGRLTVDATCRSPRVDLRLEGDVGAEPPYEASLRVTALETSLDPYLRLVRPAMPSSLGVVASGEVRVAGPLLQPGALRVEADAAELLVSFPDYPVRNDGPLDVAVRDGHLQVRQLRLAGEGTDLAVEGDLALLEDGPVRLRAEGRADLRALSGITRRLRGRGDARLRLDVSGTRDAPRVEGVVELEGVGLRARGFPHGLDDVEGIVRFSESEARFEALRGRLAGGEVSLGGSASYAGGRLAAFDVDGTGRDVSLRYPEGLRSRVDADLRFFGDAENQWLTGRLDVRQAAWTRRYDLASELLAGGTLFAEPTGGLGEGVRLDLEIEAPGTLRIDNNLATLEASADLRLQGTDQAPVLLGRAEVERGRVYFQGNTYVIRRGVIDFVNPRRIDPLFEIEAETRLRSYRVTLRANGTLDRVSPTLTSDPPLSAVQILSLLAGAEDVSSLTQAQADRANLAATGAATLAAGALSEEVGLERGAERLFGLNRFSIDPSVLRGGVTRPSARLTVGKRLTPDLNVLYSVDLSGTEERLLSVEYTLSDRLSLLLTSSDPDGVGFDVRLRQSFR